MLHSIIAFIRFAAYLIGSKKYLKIVKKLDAEGEGSVIKTVRGVGYKLETTHC